MAVMVHQHSINVGCDANTERADAPLVGECGIHPAESLNHSPQCGLDGVTAAKAERIRNERLQEEDGLGLGNGSRERILLFAGAHDSQVTLRGQVHASIGAECGQQHVAREAALWCG